MIHGHDHHLFKLPDDHRHLTADERRWIEVLRDLYPGPVRAPRLVEVQTLRGGAMERDNIKSL